MDVKASLHELLAAFTSDLKGIEKHLKQSITDVGSEFRGTLGNLRTTLQVQNSGLQTQLERLGEQITALNTSLNDQFDELRRSKEKSVDGAGSATDRKGPDLPEVEASEFVDERSARLEAAIQGLHSKNKLIQWQLGIVAVGVALPYIRSAAEHILALCQR
ncbi:hypothetical protein [Pseudomonas vanderleydeniana]|uniref:Uncharacterized protein n=1 Tax=Pseudomonas vanderleydeniana TaxID=2745495 RepID=A0A9E6TPI9_9PSED|nr:hypothetical protein [Pseudomonas vanderleydeniana]QXI25859.1 hypothetical protein HU752_017975 [Pseudomonas vanderleydeniana]